VLFMLRLGISWPLGPRAWSSGSAYWRWLLMCGLPENTPQISSHAQQGPPVDQARGAPSEAQDEACGAPASFIKGDEQRITPQHLKTNDSSQEQENATRTSPAASLG